MQTRKALPSQTEQLTAREKQSNKPADRESPQSVSNQSSNLILQSKLPSQQLPPQELADENQALMKQYYLRSQRDKQLKLEPTDREDTPPASKITKKDVMNLYQKTSKADDYEDYAEDETDSETDDSSESDYEEEYESQRKRTRAKQNK